MLWRFDLVSVTDGDGCDEVADAGLGAEDDALFAGMLVTCFVAMMMLPGSGSSLSRCAIRPVKYRMAGMEIKAGEAVAGRIGYVIHAGVWSRRRHKQMQGRSLFGGAYSIDPRGV